MIRPLRRCHLRMAAALLPWLAAVILGALVRR